ncbi:hypothetical protein BFW38_01105 [Terasakiispira papahanaumokuakeensis]|uniref:YitT family protein n=1 Tax=Terasakiispira papahanaumokuakeensis TaxID=197479 RepID=A0A1E2V6R3_9GAMM|nr:YitT family protein [Terasakiispira papahanaumokuakeensis]ODC02345.1 hypothetical protein BFW38_01105 [Terasakiispira papahanaumokuakeensis]
MTTVDPVQHSLLEDMVAMLLGTALVALGIAFYTHAQLLTGSTAGMAFLLTYASDWRFGPLFFLINIPFYIFGVMQMGWRFTCRTFVAVGLVSLFSELTPQWVTFSTLAPAYAAILGGLMMGVGFLILFRHKASLGGVNILSLYLQDRYGIRAGKFQMGVDVCIVAMAFWVVPWPQVLLSVLGAVAMNLVVALNHRSGRYIGVS